jgi:GT2 family glycosyltransferase
VIQHGRNLGYCEGNNVAAAQARGDYLFFLNNDAWLEPDCLETLIREVDQVGASAATPLVLNYEEDTFQSAGASGFDLFGLVTCRGEFRRTRMILMPEGCSYLIRRAVFKNLGGFDPEFFMFSDETDLSWRVWIAGFTAITVPSARLHHRGAAQVNPRGGGTMVEFRTSDTKRYFANRNSLLLLLKNAQHLLLALIATQVILLLLEAFVGLILTRRWSFVKRAYVHAIRDCWRMRMHILKERRRVRSFRIRSDWWMLRFLRLRPNRWDELLRLWRIGVPTVTSDQFSRQKN